MSEAEQFEEINDIVDRIDDVLSRCSSEITSTVLADLTARWVTSHHSDEGIHKTRRLRARLLHHYLQAVHKLIDSYSRRDDT